LSSPSSELPLSYLLTDTTVIIEDLGDESELAEEVEVEAPWHFC
jgi:hypothetical protein